MNTKQAFILAFMLGFSCFIVQLVMLREFLVLFMGNELVIGIMLAMWMLLTATGAFSGRYLFRGHSLKYPVLGAIMLSAAVPAGSVFLAVWIRQLLYAPGVMTGLPGLLLITFSGLVFFCMLSGMLFTFLASALSGPGKQRIAHIYAVEAAGSLAGGVIFNFILIYSLNAVFILCLLMIINLTVATWYAISNKLIAGTLTALVMSGLAIAFLMHYNPDALLAALQSGEQNIVYYRDTPFGKLMVSKKAGQVNFYHNGKPAYSNDNLIEKEEKVHYAMCLHPAPKKVLVLEGGLDGSLSEVMKYPVESLDYVDPDPWTAAAAENYFGLIWPDGARIIFNDPRNFLLSSKQAYDIILLNAGPPQDIGSNRYYTEEFFRLLKKRLREGGILSLRLPGAANYMRDESLRLHSSIYNALKKEFTHIRTLPGQQVYYLASSEFLPGAITRSIEAKNIPTSYVNEWYLDDALMARRSEQLEASLLPDTAPNSDQKPVVSYLSILQWLGMLKIPFLLTLIIPLALMILLVIALRPVNLGLFTTGFSASALELLLLFSFQAYYGYLYQMAGLIIMLFMGGLAMGAGWLYTFIRESKRSFIRIQMIMAMLAAGIPLFLFFSSGSGINWLHGAVACLLIFVTGSVTGLQFRLGTMISGSGARVISAKAYGADLSGSAFGIFFVSVALFPLMGFMQTGMTIAFFNIIVAARLRRA